MTHVLVTGGAGYIGSHCCRTLAEYGFIPVTYDNLVNGHQRFVRWGPFEFGDINDEERLSQVIEQYSPICIIHFAAFAYVGESVKDPVTYYNNNVCGTVRLLNAAVKHKINKFIFSGSCATYGIPLQLPIAEEHPCAPINPYGRTKLIVEEMLPYYDQAYGLKSTVLKYFNAAGAHPDGTMGEFHFPETHLIPLVLDVAAGKQKRIHIFGNDYDTPDGTCVRDYVHVVDLAEAHVLALQRMLHSNESEKFNLCNENGCSVLEIINNAELVTGKSIPFAVLPRREGDPPVLIGSSQKARSTLQWKPLRNSILTQIEDAWRWHQNQTPGE